MKATSAKSFNKAPAGSPKNFDGKLPSIAAQAQQGLPMPFRILADTPDIPLSMIAAQASKRHALLLCMQVSGKNDSQIGEALGINPGHFSRIKSGDSHFPEDKEIDLMQICGNYIPLIWTVYRCGFDPESLKPLRSALEAELEEKKQHIAELENERILTMHLLRELKCLWGGE